MQSMLKNILGEATVRAAVFSDYNLPLRRTFYPLGYPLHLETNSQDVVEAAAEGWGMFSQTFDEPPVRLCLNVTDSDTGLSGLRSEFRWHEHLMLVLADPENFMV